MYWPALFIAFVSISEASLNTIWQLGECEIEVPKSGCSADEQEAIDFDLAISICVPIACDSKYHLLIDDPYYKFDETCRVCVPVAKPAPIAPTNGTDDFKLVCVHGVPNGNNSCSCDPGYSTALYSLNNTIFGCSERINFDVTDPGNSYPLYVFLGGILLILFLLCMVWRCVRKKKQTPNAQSEQPSKAQSELEEDSGEESSSCGKEEEEEKRAPPSRSYRETVVTLTANPVFTTTMDQYLLQRKRGGKTSTRQALRRLQKAAPREGVSPGLDFRTRRQVMHRTPSGRLLPTELVDSVRRAVAHQQPSLQADALTDPRPRPRGAGLLRLAKAGVPGVRGRGRIRRPKRRERNSN